MIGTLTHADTCEKCGRAIAAGETVRGVPIGGGWAFECRECAHILTFGPFPVVEAMDYIGTCECGFTCDTGEALDAHIAAGCATIGGQS
jgi:hypothetical protein